MSTTQRNWYSEAISKEIQSPALYTHEYSSSVDRSISENKMPKLMNLPPEHHQMIVNQLVFEYLNSTGTTTCWDLIRLQDVSEYWNKMILRAVAVDRRKRQKQ